MLFLFIKAVLKSHLSGGLLTKWKQPRQDHRFCFRAGREKKHPLLRGETLARLMRRTAVRQSSSSLRFWCLSMIHSMIQNILKYRTVIISLQNTHLHVQGIYILNFFHSGGSCLPWRQNCWKAHRLCLYILTQWVCCACCFFFSLRNDDRQERIIILIQHRYLRLRLIMFCLHM